MSFILAALLFLQGPMFPGPGGRVYSGGGGAYSGPGDVVASAVGWWGLRAYSAAYATSAAKALQLCTAADAACTDINVTSTGVLSSANLTTSGCSGIDTCTVKFLYDQSGGLACSSAACDLTQGTISKRPTFKNNCVGGKPCLQCAAASSQVLVMVNGTFFSSYTQPFQLSYATDRTGGFSAYADVVSNGGSTIQAGFDTVANGLLAYAGGLGTVGSIADSSFHAVQTTFNGASSVIYVDGTSNTVSSGAASIGAVNLCGSANYLTGNITEVGFWSSGFSGGQNSSMNSNQRTYWGF